MSIWLMPSALKQGLVELIRIREMLLAKHNATVVPTYRLGAPGISNPSLLPAVLRLAYAWLPESWFC